MNNDLVSLSRTDQESAYNPYKQVMMDLPHLSGEFLLEQTYVRLLTKNINSI